MGQGILRSVRRERYEESTIGVVPKQARETARLRQEALALMAGTAGACESVSQNAMLTAMEGDDGKK